MLTRKNLPLNMPEAFLDLPDVAQPFADEVAARARQVLSFRPEHLEPRIWDNLAYVSSGKSRAEVARELGVSAHVLNERCENVVRKLGLASFQQAVYTGFVHGAIEPAIWEQPCKPENIAEEEIVLFTDAMGYGIVPTFRGLGWGYREVSDFRRDIKDNLCAENMPHAIATAFNPAVGMYKRLR